LALSAMPPVAVQNDAQMSRYRLRPDLPRQPAFVNPIERRQHMRPRWLLVSHLTSELFCRVPPRLFLLFCDLDLHGYPANASRPSQDIGKPKRDAP
jgi:hypothetical protein